MGSCPHQPAFHDSHKVIRVVALWNKWKKERKKRTNSRHICQPTLLRAPCLYNPVVLQTTCESFFFTWFFVDCLLLFLLWVVSTCVLFCLVYLMDEFPSLIFFIHKVFLLYLLPHDYWYLWADFWSSIS